MSSVLRRAKKRTRRSGGRAPPDQRARMLPSFLIIGAQRAGTTSLFAYVGRPPGRRVAPGRPRVPPLGEGAPFLRRQLLARDGLVSGVLPPRSQAARSAAPGPQPGLRRGDSLLPLPPGGPKRVAATLPRRPLDRAAQQPGRAGVLALSARAQARNGEAQLRGGSRGRGPAVIAASRRSSARIGPRGTTATGHRPTITTSTGRM